MKRRGVLACFYWEGALRPRQLGLRRCAIDFLIVASIPANTWGPMLVEAAGDPDSLSVLVECSAALCRFVVGYVSCVEQQPLTARFATRGKAQ